ncbi:IS3 family transposase [Pseudalkalibacillus sp. A8]
MGVEQYKYNHKRIKAKLKDLSPVKFRIQAHDAAYYFCLTFWVQINIKVF